MASQRTASPETAHQKPRENQKGEAKKEPTTDEADRQDTYINRALELLWRHRYGGVGAGLFCLFLVVICRAAGHLPDGSPPLIPVSGQVLIDGKPLAHGEVRFIPDGARASIGMLDKDGRFTLTCYDGSDGAVPGTHRVEVAPAESLDESEVRWQAPEKYASFETSDLIVEIASPTDALVIELRGDGAQPPVKSE